MQPFLLTEEGDKDSHYNLVYVDTRINNSLTTRFETLSYFWRLLATVSPGFGVSL